MNKVNEFIITLLAYVDKYILAGQQLSKYTITYIDTNGLKREVLFSARSKNLAVMLVKQHYKVRHIINVSKLWKVQEETQEYID